MAVTIGGDNAIAGSISFSSPSFSIGSGAINGGYNFDLPLATVAAFNQSALNFSAANSANAQGFLTGIVNRAQDNLSGATKQAFQYGQSSLATLAEMNRVQQDALNYRAKKAYGGGGCFITTAVTKAAGKSDKCAELQILRKFRDDYMLATEEGQKLVALYYATAPAIVEKLDAGQLHYLASNFIYPAISQIAAGNFEQAQGIYVAMVHVAAKYAGVSLEVQPVEKECNCGAGKKAKQFHKKTCPIKQG